MKTFFGKAYFRLVEAERKQPFNFENAKSVFPEEEQKRLIEMEQYLNSEVSATIWQKFQIGFRIHLTQLDLREVGGSDE